MQLVETKTVPIVSFDERLAAALSSVHSSAQLHALLIEAGQAEQAAIDAASEARELALDPATKPPAVADARRAMEDAQFRRDRMATATIKLTGLVAEAKKREDWAVIQKDIDKALVERDQLAKELKDRYPVLARELADLILRLSANNAQLDYFTRVHSVNLRQTAETIARNVPEHWATSVAGHSQPPLLQARIPSFEPMSGGYLWPR